MPEQPATPPKPKPGSLRDRIAAFEKPAVSGPAPGPPPVHRPKPGGISWKPKVPSPPSSPSSTDHERKAAGGMSASDAKESIGKGGSLKERMAALQNRGGFGAPPPVAPKPALEKPKWKPPPVIAPVDKDDDEEVLPRGESSKSPPPLSPPPLARKSVDEGSLKEPVDEEPVTTAPEGEDQAEADPEDEERQRRAAIAARMARLGGARVGMAPMFAPKPAVKKPEPVGEPAKAKPTSDEQVVPPKEPTTEEVTPPIEPATEEQPSVSPEPSSEIPPATKESESMTTLSPDQPPQSRGPGAMPLPSAPRRAAPPRKKAAKSPSPEQPLPPAPVVEEETLVRSPVPAPALASAEASELAAIVAENAKKEETGEFQAEVTELGEVENKNAEDSAVPPPGELEHAIIAEPTPVVPTDLAEKDAMTGESIAAKEPSLEVKESTEKTAEDEEGLIEPPKSVDAAPPSHAASVPEDAREDEEEEEEEEEAAKKLHEPLEAEPKALAKEIPPSTVEETEEEPTAQAQLTDEPDEEEEAARHKRLAEKVAKMGGINPFALPPQPQRKPSVSSDDGHTTVSPRASVSREPSIGSPPPPPPPQRRQSTRKDSVDSSVVHDVSSQPQPQRKPSVSSDDGSVRREPSIGSPPLIPPQRRQSTRRDSVDSSTLAQGSPTILQSPVIHPAPLRKDSADFDSAPAAPPEFEHAVKKRNSQDVGPSSFAVGGDIPEETEYVEEEDEEGEEEIISDDDEQRKTTTYQSETPTRNELVEDLEEEVIEVAPPPSLPPSSPPPPVPKSTRPLPVVPVDPTLPVDPIPVPPRPAAQTHHTAVSPPARSLPPPPPPRLVEEEAEEEEEEEEEEQWKAARVPPRSQYVDKDEDEDVDSDGDDYEPPRRLPPRSLPTPIEDDGSPVPVPVPVPNRQSSRDARSSLHIPPHRAIPPPPPPPQDIEQDSDFDEVLPTPPRRLPMTPSTPPTNEIPLIVPPPHEEEDRGARKVDRSPLRQSVHVDAVPAPVVVSRGEVPSPSHLSVSEQEIYDEEEGDPIDPSFHSPSRRASAIILPPTSPPPPPPQESVTERGEEEETAQQAHRRTIAERMAKLGGIKFGAAPPPASMRPTSPPARTEAEAPTAAPVPAGPEGEGEHVELSEEEEERARKERIAAKLAGMGGMRIGMLPLGVGTLRPQHSHVLTGNAPHPPPPARAQPPPPPPPPPQDSDAELEGNLSASQQSFSTTSEDGVKVEAEESEIEEVSHEDAVEEEVEEVPPPVPDRGARRRGTGSESEVLHSPTVASYPRPPVPTTLPTKRSSVQTTISVRKSSVESSGSVPVPRSSTHKPHSEYVMVEEPSGFTSDDTVPPLPPARPTSRVPHPSRGVPPPPPPATELSDSSLTQWELPSIPSSSLTFGTSPDLSLSWTEEPPTSPTVSSPPPPSPPEKPAAQQPTAERHLSPDDLIAVWGRVGVQICEVATSLFEKSKRSLVGDGTYTGFVNAVLSEVPNAYLSSYGYVIYVQSGTAVQKRVSEIMPGDIVILQDAKLKGHKGIHAYHQNVGVGEELVGVVSEFEPKKSKIRVFQANQHVGQQTVEAVSYRLEDLKSGTVKIYRVLEN
ncbi:hypothetical protein Hypma_016405 [Hypsizygus marmoreus]|uniref:BBC1/AIM3 cysteine proteinase-fold domain-containing protein n=1 Tax=Hypsizygus marmoreus TaxID=39966 RepID=A0A369J4T9_HYPMA|nr:hypothetical protein Hypma_016405 [Hypsizygus marmoreus]